MIQFIDKLLGLKETEAAITSMPPLLRETAKYWMFSERKKNYARFKKRNSGLKRNAKAPSMFRRSGTWDKGSIGPFHGVSMRDGPNEVSMTTGLGSEGKSKSASGYIRRLALMEKSYPGSQMVSSGKLMMIPLIKNLYKIGAGRMKDSSNTGPYSNLYNNAQARMRESNYAVRGGNLEKTGSGMFAVRKGGNTYWFNPHDRFKNGKLRKSALLFIGKRVVNLRKRIDFVNPFKQNIQSVERRFTTKVRRTLGNISRGQMSIK